MEEVTRLTEAQLESLTAPGWPFASDSRIVMTTRELPHAVSYRETARQMGRRFDRMLLDELMTSTVEQAAPEPGLTIERLTATMQQARARAPQLNHDALACQFDLAQHRLTREIFFHYRPGGAPPARRIRLDYDVGQEELVILVDVVDGRSCRVTVPTAHQLNPGALGPIGFDRVCLLMWDGIADSYNRGPLRRFSWREDSELRQHLEDALRGRPRTVTYGHDLARERDRMAMMPYGVMHGLSVADGPAPVALSPAMIEELRRANEERDVAVKRGAALLRSWLTPEQLADYQKRGSFEVRGGATGRRYRIRSPGPHNIDLLNSRSGEVVQTLCFMPQGDLVGGDIMLAQKLALETNERAALAVANVYEAASGSFVYNGFRFDTVATI